MKAQTRRGSMLESAVNLVVGFALSWAINYFALPLFGMHPSQGSLWGLGAIFTVASVVRSYCLRRVFERLRLRKVPPDFLYIIEDIAAERHRQISGEGYSLAHDDAYRRGDLADAAAAYAFLAAKGDDLNRHRWKTHALALWPWREEAFKPTTPRRDLLKSSAMIVAEIGRLDRKAARGAP